MNVNEDPFIDINWFQSDVCIQFYCQCGAMAHFDVPAIEKVQCKVCKREYKLPRFVDLTPQDPA